MLQAIHAGHVSCILREARLIHQVAVVVDTFADARQNDVQNLAEEMEDEIEHDRGFHARVWLYWPYPSKPSPRTIAPPNI